MKVVGLTGSIGMGKSTTSAMFADLGVPIWDADGAVHRLYVAGGQGGRMLSESFGQAVRDDGSVDREKLSGLVLGNFDALKKLEAIIHPLVGKDRADFLFEARQSGHKIAIVDVPLLFETGGNQYVDKVIVVSCDPDIQRARVLARDGMTEEKFAAILARQTPDAQKRAGADFIIETGRGLDAARKQVREVYDALLLSAGAEKAKFNTKKDV